MQVSTRPKTDLKTRTMGCIAVCILGVLPGAGILSAKKTRLDYSKSDIEFVLRSKTLFLNSGEKAGNRIQIIKADSSEIKQNLWHSNSSLNKLHDLINSLSEYRPAAVVIDGIPTGPFSVHQVKQFDIEVSALKTPVFFSMMTAQLANEGGAFNQSQYPDLNVFNEFKANQITSVGSKKKVGGQQEFIAVGGYKENSPLFMPYLNLPFLGQIPHIGTLILEASASHRANSQDPTSKLKKMVEPLPFASVATDKLIESRITSLKSDLIIKGQTGKSPYSGAIVLIGKDIESLKKLFRAINAVQRLAPEMDWIDGTAIAILSISIAYSLIFYLVIPSSKWQRKLGLALLPALLVLSMPTLFPQVFIAPLPALATIVALAAGSLLIQVYFQLFKGLRSEAIRASTPSPNLHQIAVSPGEANFNHFEGAGSILVVGGIGIEEIPEKFTASEFFKDLSSFENAILRIIQEERGISTGTIVSGVTAFFGFPYQDSNVQHHADSAFRAGQKIQREVVKWITSADHLGKPAFPIRVGIDSGQISLGNLTGNQGIELAILGTAAENAKVLQAASSSFSVLLSSATRDLLLQGDGRNISAEQKLIQIRGRSELFVAYEHDPFKEAPEVRHQAFEILRNCLRRQVARKRWPFSNPALINMKTSSGIATANNFSKGGLALILDQRQSVGTRLEVSLDTADGSLKRQLAQHQIHQLFVEIRWSKPMGSRFLHGCKYVEINESNLNYLLTCILSSQIELVEAV